MPDYNPITLCNHTSSACIHHSYTQCTHFTPRVLRITSNQFKLPCMSTYVTPLISCASLPLRALPVRL
jgi:hypothetical protein